MPVPHETLTRCNINWLTKTGEQDGYEDDAALTDQGAPPANPGSRTRMAFAVDVEEMLDVEVGVVLGRGQALVAEEFLDDAEVGPAVQEMRGEGMAQGVRADLEAEGGSA